MSVLQELLMENTVSLSTVKENLKTLGVQSIYQKEFEGRYVYMCVCV